MKERVRLQRRNAAPQTPQTVAVKPSPAALEATRAVSDGYLGHAFSRIPVQRPQAKLTVSQPDDPQEQEAEKTADRVMRAEAPPTPGKNAAVDEEEEKPAGAVPETASRQVMRRESGDAEALGDVSPVVGQGLSGGGQPLDDMTRSFMEPRFGHDFSQVRIHTDAQAAQSAQAVSARAYTVGGDIAFAPGEYNPASAPGRQLLAHELTHTIQQGAARQVQRDPDPNASPAPGASQPQNAAPNAPPQNAPGTGPATLDGEVVATQQDLAGWYDRRLQKLSAQAVELQQGGQIVPAALAEASAQGQHNKQDALAGGKAALDISASLTAQSWLDYKYIAGMNGAEGLKAMGAADKLKEAAAKAQATALSLETTVVPAMRERQSAAFKKADDSALAKWADLIFNCLDTALDLKDGATQLINTSGELYSIGDIAIKDVALHPPVQSKVPDVLKVMDVINKAYSVFQLVQSGIDVMSAHKTGADDAKAGVKAMAVAIDAGGNLLGVSAGLNFYINWYIGPMTDLCLAKLSKLEDVGHDVNRDLIMNGLFDKVNWDLEPGGRSVFDFMLAVMRAGDSGGVPKPVPEAVSKYLVKNEDEINAGEANKSEMPTEGHWFWRKTDPAKIAEWVFNQRADLWGMFYGDIAVPK